MNTYYCELNNLQVAYFDPVKENSSITLKPIPEGEFSASSQIIRKEFGKYGSSRTWTINESVSPNEVIARALDQYKYWYETTTDKIEDQTILYDLIINYNLSSDRKLDLLSNDNINSIKNLYNNEIANINSNKIKFQVPNNTPSPPNSNLHMAGGILFGLIGALLLIGPYILLYPILFSLEALKERKETKELNDKISSFFEANPINTSNNTNNINQRQTLEIDQSSAASQTRSPSA